ncbi:MAG TPA: ATP-binding protein [Silvibacterium sp.]|nr:ATP-binding protein [Silvibacterium sp.]
MRLKTKLAAAITGLVFLVVSVLSWLYISKLLQQYIEQSYLSTEIIANQLFFTTRQALENGLPNKKIDVNDPAAVRAAVAAALRKDAALNALINSVINYAPTVLDISIVDRNGRGLVTAPDPSLEDKLLPQRPNYAALRKHSLVSTLEIVFGPPRVYNVSLELTANNQPVLNIRIGIRTTFLENALRPSLIEAIGYASLAILLSLIAAAFVANLALAPIAQISARLDALSHVEAEMAEEAAAEPEPELSTAGSSDTVVQVSHKIERLGRRMRNVEEVFSALKENLDQILSNLQDGMMLFTRDARAVLVSRSVERFLYVDRDRVLGASVDEIFDQRTVLGRTVHHAFEAGLSIAQEELTTETGRRVEVSLDFIHDDHASFQSQSLGALLTLHDLESVREIESELEVSRRMAAIGRLTSGVGHEVKNPINAIVVHLELLRSKITADSSAARHLEIIQSEIRRLDRVVQTLVDFSRPVELQLKDQDLRSIVSAVLMLASAEMETRNITVVNEVPTRPVNVRVDADLLRQALLNVVLNGAQAMANGGELSVRLTEDSRAAILKVEDHGEGIPNEIRDRIFDLYFTTKREGSGIGLAMTYRILQLHHGQLDVESRLGKGSTFTLRIPVIPISDSATNSGLRGLAETKAESLKGIAE